MRPVTIAVLIVALAVALILMDGDSAVSPVSVGDLKRNVITAAENKEVPIPRIEPSDRAFIQSAGLKVAEKAVEADTTTVTELTDPRANRSFINVGSYIDPDEVPAAMGERINIGGYIDPEALPEYPAREVNVGAYIDPEDLPEGSDASVNYGDYKDPDAPVVLSPGQVVNVGRALPPP